MIKIKQAFLSLIRFYQKTKFFHLPIFKTFYLSDQVCRFTPTCSQYCFEVIEKYGIIRGSLMALKRIIRCHPWNKGGEDPVP